MGNTAHFDGVPTLKNRLVSFHIVSVIPYVKLLLLLALCFEVYINDIVIVLIISLSLKNICYNLNMVIPQVIHISNWFVMCFPVVLSSGTSLPTATYPECVCV
jgi:hypothetical protein